MKLFVFEGSEADWVAAHDEAEARETLCRHYGIPADDIQAVYNRVSEVDPTGVDVDVETAGSPVRMTASAAMAGRTQPFIVGSTAY